MSIEVKTYDLKVRYAAGDVPRVDVSFYVIRNGCEFPDVEEVGLALVAIGKALDEIEKYEEVAIDWLEEQKAIPARTIRIRE